MKTVPEINNQSEVKVSDLLTPIHDSRIYEVLEHRWKTLVEQQLFVAVSMLKWNCFDHEELFSAVDSYWHLSTEVRLNLAREPLFSYAVNRLLHFASNKELLGDSRSWCYIESIIEIFNVEIEFFFCYQNTSSVQSTLEYDLAQQKKIKIQKEKQRSKLESLALDLPHASFRFGEGDYYREIGEHFLEKYSNKNSALSTRSAFSDLHCPNLNNRLYQSLNLILMHLPDWYFDLQFFTKVIVPIETPYATGFSVDICRGLIFITVENNILDTVDHLIHETAHNKLDMINDFYSILEPTQGSTFISPWREDLRPMEGILHGAYVFTCVSHAFVDLQNSINDSNGFLKNRINSYYHQVSEALATIDRYAKLTNVGKEFVDALHKWHKAIPV
ncbi:aKG-HExxH-type peptide beta-hydroxylase [Leptolyngbya sp. 7M]|uniref:aKG-HExxH-type peptide beta-hydroxylase n=1 Tax=Leptolyngbya sp. 7M TaxID=2812896 RepID=UPI001B8AFDB1|nr:HEXXH motif-containing putative peptide modification protein [Leptolyngbya sp. 7M]QYO67101.1 hypothetical protein JVX88_09985 [Leptolyngbya sp. 7M]